jgi:hypothetical protein
VGMGLVAVLGFAFVLFVGGGCLIALTRLAVYARRHQQNSAQRAGLVAGMLLIGGFALFSISLGMIWASIDVVPESASQHLIDLAVQVFGVGMILIGICAAWWVPRDNHGYIEKYRGAPQLPTLRRFIATIGVACGVFLVSAGVLFVAGVPPLTSAAFIIMGALSAAGALVAMGGAFGTAIVMHRAEVWRQRQL